MNAAFILSLIALVSGFFSLGGVTLLFMQRRTVFLRQVLLFLLSLVLINAGFWLQGLFSLLESTAPLQAEGVTIMTPFFFIAGFVINVSIVPNLVAGICFRSVERPLRQILWFWNGILLSAGILYPFLKNPGPILGLMNIQLLVTITASLVFLAIQIKNIPQQGFRKAASAFLIASAAFLVLLVLDMLLTRFEIEKMYFMEGLSLPLYIIALNIGSFFFSGRLLNSDALMQNGKITEDCRRGHSITGREAELIELLVEGHTNQELADLLFISKKTVENHLYNIYQKMGVKSRMQLLGSLKSWQKTGWE